MAREPFLINPPKSRRTRRSAIGSHALKLRDPKRFSSLLGKEGSKHRPTVYSHGGHWFTSSRAKVARPGLKLNFPFRRRRKTRRNPFGEEAMLVGLNPARRRSTMSFFHRRRKHHKRRHNPVHRRKHYAHRRYRRNPFSVAGSLNTAGSYATPIAGVIGGMVAVRALPRLLGVSGLPFYGVQLAVIIGGNYAVKKLSAKAAEGFVLGAAGTAVYDIAKGFLGTTFSYLGLGEETLSAYPQVGAYTDENAAYGELADYHQNL